jgi:hypothetical protein
LEVVFEKFDATVTELRAFGGTHFQSALHLSVQNHFVKDAQAIAPQNGVENRGVRRTGR